MSQRISWDEYFIEMAVIASKRATCPRKRIGAIIVNDKKQVVATGFNGSPKGFPHCDDVGCMIVKRADGKDNCARTIHAEANAIFQAGEQAHGATLYATVFPCPFCLKSIIQAGIKRVVYIEDYKNEESEYWITHSGMKVERWNDVTKEAEILAFE